jgi:putative oxidoreductase
MNDVLIMIGQAAMGLVFIVAGVSHFGRLADVTALMTANGVPFARVLLIVGSLFQIAAGSLLAAGLFIAPAALGLAAFTVAATLMVLRFWTMPPGPARHGASNAFLINIGIVGGLLIAAGLAR